MNASDAGKAAIAALAVVLLWRVARGVRTVFWTAFGLAWAVGWSQAWRWLG